MCKVFSVRFLQWTRKAFNWCCRILSSPFNEIETNSFNPPPLYWSMKFSSPRLNRRTQKWNFRQSEQCGKSPWRRNGLRWKSSSSFHGQSADDKNLSLKCLDGFLFFCDLLHHHRRGEKTESRRVHKRISRASSKVLFVLLTDSVEKRARKRKGNCLSLRFCVSSALRTKGKYFRRPWIESLQFILALSLWDTE